MKSIFILIIVAIIFLAGAGGWFFYANKTGFGNANPVLTGQAYYLCDEGKTIDASYYATPQRAKNSVVPTGKPPVPNGKVYLVLSNNRKLTLPQTISASGIRYANSNESFIFWSKGNAAFIIENNTTTFSGCIVLAPDTNNMPEAYATSAAGFSIRYPAGYVVDETYKYQQLGPGKDIRGVKFIIPENLATGTNLSSFDTGVSVESIPNAQTCEASLFIDQPSSVSTTTDNDVLYSFATTSGAGAGNFYEEQVWAIPETNPCLAVRYFIHSSNIGNYTPGTVKEFDRQALIKQFDQIRHSLVISQ